MLIRNDPVISPQVNTRDDPPRILDGSVDLHPIANDPGVLHQPLTIARREASHGAGCRTRRSSPFAKSQ
jgi:hypothetical protein